MAYEALYINNSYRKASHAMGYFALAAAAAA